jgi:hypothetical protein
VFLHSLQAWPFTSSFVCLQAGKYTFNITSPTTVSGVVVQGDFTAVVKGGPASTINSNASITAPASPVVGSSVTALIHLIDEYGNPTSIDESVGSYNNTFLAIEDTSGGG